MEKVNVEPLVREYLECLFESSLDKYKENVLARLLSDEEFIKKLSLLLNHKRQRVKRRTYNTKKLAALPGDDLLLKKVLTEIVDYHAENFDSFVFKYLTETDFFRFVRGLSGRINRFKIRLPKKNRSYSALEQIIEKVLEDRVYHLESMLNLLQKRAQNRERDEIAAWRRFLGKAGSSIERLTDGNPRREKQFSGAESVGAVAAIHYLGKGNGKAMQTYLTDFTCFTYDQMQKMFSYAPFGITCLLCNQLFRTSHFKKEALKKMVLRKKKDCKAFE